MHYILRDHARTNRAIRLLLMVFLLLALYIVSGLLAYNLVDPSFKPAVAMVFLLPGLAASAARRRRTR
uniref:hypothetical protein n=1 Tax=Saccharothrix espanaensis TaxID=103731 RepID=UPI003F4930CA